MNLAGRARCIEIAIGAEKRRFGCAKRIDEQGLAEALGQLPGLCAAFNAIPGNGHAAIRVVDGEFMSLTIIFECAVVATMHCGARVFTVDKHDIPSAATGRYMTGGRR